MVVQEEGEEDEAAEAVAELVTRLGPVCSGYEVGTVITAILHVMADCAVQGNIPKHEFLADVHEALAILLDKEENDNGSSAYN